MSYEEQIRAKHQFEDAFKELLKILSIMDRRELEVVVARIGDGLKSDKHLDNNSALLTAKIVQMMLSLRARNQLTESNVMRIWFRRKKKVYAHAVASSYWVRQIDKYSAEVENIKQIRAMENRAHQVKIRKWKAHVDSLSFWDRIFNKPPYPGWTTLTPFPERPINRDALGSKLSKSKSFGEILIEVAYHYTYPNIEYADDYVKEESVRVATVQLLENKGK